VGQSALVAGLAGLRRLSRRGSAGLGAIILLIVAVLAVSGPALSPRDPLRMNPVEALSPPTATHPFGTDQYGRDVLSRVVAGARLSLFTGLGAVVIALVGGLALGLVSGAAGGWVDLLVMRVVDVMMAFPSVLMALVVVAIVGQGAANVMVAVGVSLIPTFVRLIRGNVLVVREHAYIEAARALGGQPSRITLQHILPNIVAPVIVLATIAIAWSIIIGASLSFLGLGPRPPIPEWGVDLSNGRNYLLRGWWISGGPGLAIMTTVVAVNLVGDTLRDVLDPRMRSLTNL
jgi:peptide/nickel transport system permease protein